MPLQTGSWKINSSSVLGTLAINGIDAQGNVQGQLTSGGSASAITGLWDEISAQLKFTTSSGPMVIAYTGYMFADRFRMPGTTGGSVLTLTGYYEIYSLQPVGGSTDRFVFGWYAQLGQA